MAIGSVTDLENGPNELTFAVKEKKILHNNVLSGIWRDNEKFKI